MNRIIPAIIALGLALTVVPPVASAPIQQSSYWTGITSPALSSEKQLADMTGVNFDGFYQKLFGRCGQWYTTARDAGWPADQWPTVSKVMWRESRCQPDAWNGADAGLMQINRIHRHYMEPMGMTFPTSMFDPASNLVYARTLWERAGWEPWIFKGVVPG